ncbi:MAG: restriction endonuclease [Rhizobium sp.]|nr:restriction endonuclease [Rhizobium sp.]
MAGEELDESDELPEEEADVAANASLADPQALVDARIPEALRERFEFFSYKNAAVILSETRKAEWEELLTTLYKFEISTEIIRKAGGNESEIPKRFTDILRPLKWFETVIRGDLMIKLTWKEQVRTTKGGKAVFEKKEANHRRAGYLDGHKIDYVKNRVAFDLEWNSKDQTFDRDLYAFSAFYQAGVIDAAVLITRSRDLNDVFRALGTTLDKEGNEVAGSNLMSKYGASTTWMGKLLYRLNAGRNGGCPVLAIGIKPGCVVDWEPPK